MDCPKGSKVLIMGQGRHYEGFPVEAAYAKLMWITVSQVGFAHSHLGSCRFLQRAWQCKQAAGTDDGMGYVCAQKKLFVRETEAYP